MLKRFVFDTNVLISAFLAPLTPPFQALTYAIKEGILLRSQETDAELTSVLARPKFRRYLSTSETQSLLASYHDVAEHIPHVPPIAICRDPNDDKFLALAVHGHASYVITGDQDLLILNPFSGIPLLTPRAFLTTFGL
jgi:putative PIN family toxin of toxin-antitoxin system